MSIHPQIKKVLEIVGETDIPTKNLEPKTERLNHIQTRSKFDYHLEEIRSIKDITIALPVHKVPIRIYKNDMSTDRPLVMVFHGGGWVVGDLDSEDTTCSPSLPARALLLYLWNIGYHQKQSSLEGWKIATTLCCGP